MTISPFDQLPPEKVETSADGFPINPDVMFTDKKSRHHNRIEKRQRKFLEQCRFLAPFLEPGETIQRITTGCSPISIWEQLLSGWIVFYMKRAMFIFTDRRIFHVPTNMNFKYRGSIAQIRYADCQSLTVSRHVLKVRYNNGSTEKFIYIPGPDRAVLKNFLTGVTTGSEQEPRTHLCPNCTAKLPPKVDNCAACGQQFKSRSRATKLSWMFPGGGYFYTGHPLMGFSDAVTEVILTVLLVASIVSITKGEPAFPAALFGFILVIEKLMTVHHAIGWIEEFIPIEKPGIQRLPQKR